MSLTVGELVAYITGDKTPLKRTLAEVAATTTTTKVDADITRARAALARLKAEERGLDATGNIDLDTGQALTGAQAVKSELREVDGKTAHADVDLDVGAALAKVAMILAALGAVSAAAAGVGLAVGVGAVAGAGIGAAVTGLAGIGGAVKALGDQTKGAGQAAAQAASRQLAMASAIDRVRSAQAGLANTVASAAAAERRADEQVTAAQRDLNAARADAARQLRDLARQQEDMALAQRGALLDVRQAKEDLDRTLADPHATALQRAQAQLAYDEARQRNKELAEQAKDLARAKAEADRKGVAGSDLVTAATRRLKDAQAAAAEQQRTSAYQVAQAQQQVVEAQRAVRAASVSAGAAGASSMDKLNDSMAGLSPTGQAFARFMRGFIDGPLRDLRGATQTGLLPGLQAGIASLGPVIQRNLPAIRQFSAVFGQALGGLITIAGKLAAPFLHLATVALQALSPLAGVFDGFATAFGLMVDRMVSDGSLQQMMGALVDLFAGLLSALVPVLPELVRLAASILPALTSVLMVLVPVLVNLAVAFGPLLVGALRAVTPLLTWFGNFVAGHQSLVRDLAVAILAVVGGLKLWAIGQQLVNMVSKDNLVGLIVFGVLSLVSALVLAWRHSETFRNIVTGAFRTVQAVVMGVWHWIRDNWPYLLGMLAGPFGLAAVWIYKHWDGILDFFKRLPGRLAGAARGMWDWIKDTFKDAINAIIRWWNNLDFTAPKVHIPGTNVDVGGFTIGLPDIQPLRDRGGPGLAGHPYRVGVPELFVPGASGYFTPLDMIGGSASPDQMREAVRAGAREGTLQALAEGRLRFERRAHEVLAKITLAGAASLQGLQ